MFLPLAAMPAVGQGPASALEAKVPGLSGVERARVLSQLVDAYKMDAPAKAIERGQAALRILATDSAPSVAIPTLNEMGWAYMTLGKYDLATAHLDSALHLANRIGDRQGHARALSNMGTLAQRMGDPHRAIALFDQALAEQRTIGSQRDIANSLNNLGFVYSTDLADYGKALDAHLQALAIRERLGDSSNVALSLNNIGIVYARLRAYDRARANFDRALEIRRALGNTARVAATLNNLGDMYLEQGDFRSALGFHLRSLALRNQVGDPSAIALAHRNVGDVYAAMHQIDSARQELNEALRVAKPRGDKGLLARIDLSFAAAERAGGRPLDAERYAREGLVIAEAMGSRELVRRASEELSAAQESRGELQTALATMKRAKIVNDSIFNAETARLIADLEGRNADERRAHEIDRLRRDQALLELAASRRAMQRDAVAGAALVFALIGFLLYRRRLESARLAEQLSVTDSLTGVKNRRYLDQTIGMDVAASLRMHRAAAQRGATADAGDLVFLVLDIDKFKDVNDAFGHATGDRTLEAVAKALSETSRDADVVVRWGGEEFLVVCRFTDRRQASTTAERLRRAVEEQALTLPDGRRIEVTCSVGFAAYPFDVGDPRRLTWDQVVMLADIAAYAAKRNGRNGWVGYSAGSPPIPLSGALPRLDDVDLWVAEGRLVREQSHGVPGGPSPVTPVSATPIVGA